MEKMRIFTGASMKDFEVSAFHIINVQRMYPIDPGHIYNALYMGICF